MTIEKILNERSGAKCELCSILTVMVLSLRQVIQLLLYKL